MTSTPDPRQTIIDASLGRPFAFQQGASLHVGVLGMVGRPSGPHDEAPFFNGISRDGRSHGQLDMSQQQAADEEDQPALYLWFDDQHTLIDISAAFAGAPAGALEGSGIPTQVVDGPVSVARGGDAGVGLNALLGRLCQARLAVDPSALMSLISSEHLASFAEHQIPDQPLQAFNATMNMANFLDHVGLTSTTLVNQFAMLGFDFRSESIPDTVAHFENFLQGASVQIAWLVDDQGSIQTIQAIITLTDFLTALFTDEAMVAMLADEEQVTADDMRQFINETAEAGRLVHFNAIWQAIEFNDDLSNVIWPDAFDLTAEMASQARRLQEHAEPAAAAELAEADLADAEYVDNAVDWAPVFEEFTTPVDDIDDIVTVDSDMIEVMRASSGAMHFALTHVDGDAVAAMRAAQDAVRTVRHPDEPSEPLASFLSDVIETDGATHFWADISDMEEETEVLEAVLSAVVNAVSTHVTSAHLSGQI